MGGCSSKVSTAEETFELFETTLQSLKLENIVESYADDALIISINHEDGDRREFIGKAGAREYFTQLFKRFEGKACAKHIEGFDKPETQKVTRNVGWTMWTSVTDTFVYDYCVDFLVMNSDGRIQHHNVYFKGRPGSKGADPPAGVEKARDLKSEAKYTEPWARHGAAFGGMNLPDMVADYAEDAHIHVVNRETSEHSHFHGVKGAEQFFTEMYARVKGADGGNVLVMADSFEKRGPEMDGDTAFLAWKSDSPTYNYTFGGDTMVANDSGKFSVQLIYFGGIDKTK